MKLILSLLLLVHVSAASADCFEEQAGIHGFPADLLRAIALAESSGNPKAVGNNGSSQDLGLMQINSSWLPKLKLTKKQLLENACLNIETAARILKDNFDRFDNPWEAVGAYNASCTKLKGDACVQARQKYAWRIYRHMTSLDEQKRRRLREAIS